MNDKRILFQSKGTPEFRFLSNFHICRMEEGGFFYNSVEHLYQCLKATTGDEWKYVYESKTPSEARKRGQTVTLNSKWSEVKDTAMLRCIRIKFSQNPDLREKLLLTDGFELVEYAPWGDTYWGVGKDLKGENRLGKILMQVREEMKGL